MTRPGPVFDDAMKILADDDLDALLSVVGVVGPAELLPSELPGSALAAGDPAERAAALTAALELIAARSDPDRGRRLLRAATTLASIVLERPIIDAALKEAGMPVPIRDLPLSRELLEEGRQEGRQEGERAATLRFARRMLLRRFGPDPRIDAVAARFAELPEDQWLTRIDDATSLDDLSS